ncbi:hypothetical protein Lal_00014548 [Lupinus albus]|nr:hypothetical protein Lal_00014548 [Lupinus albus]
MKERILRSLHRSSTTSEFRGSALNRHGFLDNDANLRSYWDNRVSLHPNLLFHLTLVITATICCWMMWAIVYMAQMKPLIVPILNEGE